MLKELFESIVDNAPEIPVIRQIFIVCEITTAIAMVLAIAFGLLYGLVGLIHWMWLSF